jgi:hypothetical protein
MNVIYNRRDGKMIPGKIEYIAFQNKDKSIIWYCVRFGHKWAHLCSKDELLFEEQLKLF